MLKNTFLILGLALVVLFAVSPALAQTFGLEASGNKAQYDTANTNIYSIISTTISVVLSVAGLVFLAIMFYAGLRWMTARGNEEFISKAKEAMFGALIGFILVTISFGLSTFVFSKLIK